MQWHELSEEDKILQIYSQFSISQFYNWWCSDNPKWMEVRVKDFEMIRQTADKFKLPWSASGVYVSNRDDLKNVILHLKNKCTVWMGVQSRKRNWNSRGNKAFGGNDNNVDEWNHFFIDVDRVVKEGPATNEELANCDKLANIILDRLGEFGWNKSYCKICSGNGVQLLIKLDYPIKIPQQQFDNGTKTFFYDSKYEKIRLLISKGIGQDLIHFANTHKKELGVEVDKACFNLSRVGALPVTKNIKYDSFKWRGVVELKDGVNEGFSDYILSKETNIEVYNKTRVFFGKGMHFENIIKKGELTKHKLAQFLLNNNFPQGGINNTLWFELKILLRDSKFDLNSQEFIDFHNAIKQKHKRTFTMNIPEKEYNFDTGVINNYCINCLIPPLYELWPYRSKKQDMKLEGLKFEELQFTHAEEFIYDGQNIFEDLKQFKKQLVEGDYYNKVKVLRFTKGCVKKYGEGAARYYFDYLFQKYFSWDWIDEKWNTEK